MNLFEGRLMQDETQDKEGKRYNTWMSSRLSARTDVRKAFPKAFEEPQATLPPDSAEKRLQRLVEALESLCKYPEVPAHRILAEIRKVSGTE